MAITFALVDATPYRLRYLATQDGVISSPPAAADGAANILNDAGATPDLHTDITAVAVGGGGQAPLKALVDAGRTAYKHLGTVLSQAEARALLNSDDAGGLVLSNFNVGRAVVTITPRTTPAVNWAVDVNVDMQGDPVVAVLSQTGAAATAYVDIHYRHTYDL